MKKGIELLKDKRLFQIIFYFWIIFETFIFLLPAPEKIPFKNSDQIFHITFSFITALLFYFSFKGRKLDLLGSFVFAISYGLLMEILQGLLPFRDFSLIDFFSDVFGAGIFVIGIITFRLKD